jgi:hypothetical protein
MADENVITRAMPTPMLQKWSVLADNSEQKYRVMRLKKGEDDAVAEKKHVAQVSLAAKNSRKQALQKNKAKRIKNEIERNQVFPG